jgi:long-chain acyl-CoA synthetase
MIHETHSPAPRPDDPSRSMPRLLAGLVEEDPSRTFAKRNDGSTWHTVTRRQFADEVTTAAKGLVAAGINPGDRVAIMSRTRYEWTLLDFAIAAAGAVSVPIYETSSAEQVRWICSDAGVRVAVVETTTHDATVTQVRDDLPGVLEVLVIDDGAINRLVARGAAVDDDEVSRRSALADTSTLATVIYTSGTTGRPKGVELTHGNLVTHSINAVFSSLQVVVCTEPEARALLFLPLAHVFGRYLQMICVTAGSVMGHSPDIKHLLDDLASFQPTFALAVPRVFEKVFNTASQQATADGKGKIFDRAADVAIAYSRALDTGKIPLTLRLQHTLFAKLVYGKLLAALGGHCVFAVSGGAPLGERLGHFYRGIGLHVLEGYGLTESTAALTVNLPGHVKIGTVGLPLEGTAVRVADDGELLFSGGQIFHSYWNNPEATAAAMSGDNWFHSGDLGEIDEDGFVKITGRKKEIIVTAGGKNVAPAVLEDRLRAHSLIDQCIVVGDGQPFIAALVTLDTESLPLWAARHQKAADLATLIDDPDLVAEIQKAVDDANKAVSKAESIRKFHILPDAWTEEGGQLTPSLKLKRNVVMREFRDQVESLYS